MSVERPIVGYKKLELMRHLATAEYSREQLCEMYESSINTINQFASRHREQIREIAANLEDEFAGLWVAKKKNRIAAYQDQIDRLSESDDPKLVARTQTALRSVAEELGALPQRVHVQSEQKKVHVVIESQRGDIGDGAS